jgi:hypothetical protein
MRTNHRREVRQKGETMYKIDDYVFMHTNAAPDGPVELLENVIEFIFY